MPSVAHSRRPEFIPQAEHDLERVEGFISQDNPQANKRIIELMDPEILDVGSARCQRPLARGQDRAHRQHLGFQPGSVLKQFRDRLEYGYNGIGLGKGNLSFRRSRPR